MKKTVLCLLIAACGSQAPKTPTAVSAAGARASADAPASVAVTKTGTATTLQPHPKDPASALTTEARPVCGSKAGMRCRAVARLNTSRQLFTGAVPAGLTAADLQLSYNLDADLSTPTATVALVDAFDTPNAEADLGTYRAQFGLPACTHANGCFKKINQDGQDLANQASSQPISNSDWGGEATLDLEMASVGCPTCKILLVESYDDSNPNLYAAVDQAVASGATVVSNSWGDYFERPDEIADDVHFNHPGVAIFIASGDNAYGVGYPDASPYVFSVGGTNLGVGDNGLQEVAWDGTASGCSFYEAKPAWQTDTLCPNRAECDIAAVSDPYTGVAVYYTFPYANADGTFDVQGGWMVFGGTSVASPLVAGIFAATGHGGDTPEIAYAHPDAFYDVTQGSNGICGRGNLCNSAVGWDGPTGVGSPNGTRLAKIPAQR